MLTRSAHALIITAVGLFTLGLATANPLILGLAALPLSAFILGVTESVPGVTGARIEAPGRARAGDVIDVRCEVEVDGKPGLLVTSVDLPPEFDVVSGTSAEVHRIRRGQTRVELAFDVRATKRGAFQIGPAEIAPVPAGGVRAARTRSHGEPVDLEVHPGLIPVRRLRAMRGTAATIAPEEDVARVGLKTTDFRELREYQWGDPPRIVNWKATARLGAASDKPLVNDYEVEGRKAVWFFLDAGQHMSVGTSVENGFEVAIAAASNLALAYIDRGYKVGLHAYNAAGSQPLYPDVGQKQFLKIQRRLARLEPGPAQEGPHQAVLRCRSWLVATSPMAVFITRTEIDTDALEDAVRRLRSLTPNRKRPILVIEPQAFHLVPGGEATEGTARLLSHLGRPRHQRLRRLGAVVIPWNPETEPLERILFRGVSAHG